MKRTNSCSYERAPMMAGLIALSAVFGCGTEDEAGVESRQSAFVSVNSIPEFKGLGPIAQPTNGAGDPGMCTPNGAHSKVFFSLDTTGYVYGQSDAIGAIGSWGKYGGSGSMRTLNSRPACGFLSYTSNPYPFVIVARGKNAPNGTSDKHLFWSRGSWARSSAPPTTAVTQWAAMDGTQYNINGTPAVGTNGTTLVAVYLDDSGQLKGNYWDAGLNTFSATLSAASMPTGWTGVGSPAIAYADGFSEFLITVRLKNASNQYTLWQTAFFTTSFANGPGAWNQVALPAGAPAIQSDPAYEYDNNVGWGTLYYRGNTTKVYQGSTLSAYDFSTSTFKVITDGLAVAPNVTGNPLVIGGVPYEQGRHWVLVRGTGGILWGESINDDEMTPN